jgi:hypothetical protein
MQTKKGNWASILDVALHGATSGIEHGLHRPKSLKYFLLEARSETPEANRPTPITRLADGTPWQAASKRTPSRTTRDGLQPVRRTSRSKATSERQSSRACTIVFMLVIVPQTLPCSTARPDGRNQTNFSVSSVPLKPQHREHGGPQ